MGLDEADAKLKSSLVKAKQIAKDIEPKVCPIHKEKLDGECDTCVKFMCDFMAHSFLTSNIEQIERDNDTLNALIDFHKSNGEGDYLDNFAKYADTSKKDK